MDENKEKLSGSGSQDSEAIHDEMEELAKVFKEELDKAKKEKEAESLFKGIMIQNFFNLGKEKDMKLHETAK